MSDAPAVINTIKMSDYKLGVLCERFFGPQQIESFEESLDEMERHLLLREKLGVDTADIESWWEHGDGVSLKVMRAQSLAIIIGRRHITKHQNILAAGRMILFSSGGPVAMNAGECFTSMPGSRKLAITIDPIVFYNIYPNPDNVRDEEELDRMFTADDDVLLSMEKCETTPSDEWQLYCDMNGVSEDDIQALMSLMPEPMANVDVDDNFALSKSKIAGRGMIATRDISKGESFPMLIGADRTKLARYTNHSYNPNADTIASEDGVYCVANRDIKEGEELTTNYVDNMRISIEKAKEVRCLAR